MRRAAAVGVWTTCLMALGCGATSRDAGSDDETEADGGDHHFPEPFDGNEDFGLCDDVDADGDGVGNCTDCSDGDPTLYPGAPDFVGDGRDQDCDGVDGVDGDRDGYASVASGGQDCDDADPAVQPVGLLEWSRENVGSGRPRWGDLDLAVEADGAAHITHQDAIGYLEYSSNRSGRWERVAIDERFDVGVGSLAVRDHGAVHGAYSSPSQTRIGYNQADVLYFSNRGGAFETEIVTEEDGHHASIALDGDTPHLVYQDTLNDVLQHAVRTTAGWSAEVVGAYEAARVVVQDDGEVQVVAVADGVWFLRRLDDRWVAEPIDQEGGDVWSVDVARDDAGAVHAAYVRILGDDVELRYATNASGEWGIESIAPSGAAGLSLAVDAFGGVHVVWAQDGLWYGLRTDDGWVQDLVEPPFHEADAPAVGVDASGVAHLAYYGWDGANGNVVHAWRAGGDGIDQNCDGRDD